MTAASWNIGRLCRTAAIILIVVSLTGARAGPAAASESERSAGPPLPHNCEFDKSTPRSVEALSDTENLLLGDGQELNLGILTAGLDDAAAKRALHDLAVGRAVTLARPLESSREDTDRYGRLHANAFVRIDGKSVWLQGALVARGLARVLADSTSDCGRRDLLNLENEARLEKKGHWATGVFSVLNANDAQAVAAYSGRFAIIEGRLRRASKSRKGIYYNFGGNWREDVTVFVPSHLINAKAPEPTPDGRVRTDTSRGRTKQPGLRAFDLGLSPSRGSRLRARGWVEMRGGPLFEIHDLGQLEWIE